MLRIFLVFFCLISFTITFGQSLEGKWEGWYTFKNDAKDTVIIKLYFKLNQYNTYDVYSFTKFKDNKDECKLYYKKINDHSIYLEEKELIRTNNSSNDNMFQKMTLYVESDYRSMKGKWFYKDGPLKFSGDMAFIKKQ